MNIPQDYFSCSMSVGQAPPGGNIFSLLLILLRSMGTSVTPVTSPTFVTHCGLKHFLRLGNFPLGKVVPL